MKRIAAATGAIALAAGALVAGSTVADLTPNEATAPTSITIGETAVLGNPDNGNANLLLAQSAVLAQEAVIQSLSFYVTNAAGNLRRNLRLGIYADDLGKPGALIAETGEITTTVGWNTAPVASVLLSAGTYWLAYLSNDDNLGFSKTEDASSSGVFYAYTYGALPVTFSTSTSSTLSHWSFYATLLTSSPPPPVAGCEDWNVQLTANECFAAGVIRNVGLWNLQGAGQFCKWKIGSPGEWSRLQGYAETETPPASIVSWFGASIKNWLEAYFATGAPTFTIAPNTAPNICRTPLAPPVVTGVTPGETDATVTIAP